MALSDAERTQLQEWLDCRWVLLEAAVNGLSEAQWSYRADPETWSIAEIAQHLLDSENRVFGRIQDLVTKDPATDDEIARTNGKGALMAERIPARATRVKAPLELVVTHTCDSPEAWTAAFREADAWKRDFLATTSADLHRYVFPHFSFKELSAYQWVQMVSLHAERHVKQMEEVKAHPGYPAPSPGPTS